MKFLRDQLDKVEPLFLKGGKLEKLYPLYEATDTFLYTPGHVTKAAAHIRDSLDMKRMMIMVVIALAPCMLMSLWNTGYQANLAIANGAQEFSGSITGLGLGGIDNRDWIMHQLNMPHDPANHVSNVVYGALFFLPVYIVTLAVGGNLEALFAAVRGHEINEGFLVTSALFPLCLPPTIPLWQVALGIAFGVVVGKEIFGGTGKNFLNPALTGRAFLYFSHAGYMSGEWTKVGDMYRGVWLAADKADGVSGATVLTAMSTATEANPDPAVVGGFSWWDCFMGWIPGSMGETSTLACLLGAGILIATGIGSWRIMTGVVLGALAMSGTLWAFRDMMDNPMTHIAPHWHLVIGGFAFGAVFMATDPVSASMTEVGKWWYGALIGVMTILIRVINPAFPEGIMLAILFGNVMAPLIDYAVIQANITRREARYAT